jgi:hypothetical protein
MGAGKGFLFDFDPFFDCKISIGFSWMNALGGILKMKKKKVFFFFLGFWSLVSKIMVLP